MNRSDRYPNHVPRDEQPEATLENIPEDVIKSAISLAVTYGECPECETRQFHPVMAGHNTTHECRECGFEMRVVG